MSEAAEIKRDGMKAVPNSGRGIAKGDAILYPFLVDIKEYTESFAVSRKNWAKVSTDSFSNGRLQPAFKLCLGEEGKPPTRVWVVGDEMFHEMRDAWLQIYGEQ